MTESLLPYDQWIDSALRSVIHRALSAVAEDGLPGEHHFYVTFRTTADGVELSPALRAAHPEQMTIVLQHQFRALEVDEDAFAVTLKFKGKAERLCVPFAAVIAFADPSVQFGLQFKMVSAGDETDSDDMLEPPTDAANRAEDGSEDDPRTGDDSDAGEDDDARSGQVIALDTFRKK